MVKFAKGTPSSGGNSFRSSRGISERCPQTGAMGSSPSRRGCRTGACLAAISFGVVGAVPSVTRPGGNGSVSVPRQREGVLRATESPIRYAVGKVTWMGY
jgi:hypothetical protein